MKAWTDYPFTWLGDIAFKKAPIREVEIVSYDGDKYCHIKLKGGEDSIKRCYLYQSPGRLGAVKPISNKQLEALEATK